MCDIFKTSDGTFANLTVHFNLSLYNKGYLIAPGYLDLSNVKLIASENEPAFSVQDIYDDDTQLIADDDFNDEGTASPTASPTIKATQEDTIKSTESETTATTDQNPTDIETDPTNSPSASETTIQTVDVTSLDNSTGSTDIETDPTNSPSASETTIQTVDVTSLDNSTGGERRFLSSDDSVIDMVFFHEPSECLKTSAGCDWTKLGVGSSDHLGNIRWCCSDDVVLLGLCEESDRGRMIINQALFGGEHRPIIMPPTGNYIAPVKLPIMNTKEGTGQYSLVIANCNDNGRNVMLDGSYIWKSKGGYLPGDLFDEWKFFTVFTLGYAGLLFWYGRSMSQNKDSTIGIQKWILGTVILGLIELIFKGVDYMEWNQQGTRINAVMYLCKYSYSIS